ncbi:Very-long-chain (3R)-3-hydroxyacyl-CoA dehydratase [Amphibalanus amphitrite]|uniref:Very-long-chain (3R)-3-hydroxyacyl-CoA dehydratase n=1 Tax=Amphibalanus amphitrite TaxID=1232801 RepID=A0A6A4WH64_AMPAM|nr:Very-long-chain (3R)-3-hydroxyacyl-CoA dehydratase [Amphibalanus amphitrite]KAF0301361.1 Very-long-chain (3R)-3-hydroxyacyl-CoA dehydratase [Amphibalanus amphitrite]
MEDAVCPFVYWSQTKTKVHLKIDLREVKKPDVDLLPEQLVFRAEGLGNSGNQLYSFTLDLFQQVIPEETQYQVSDRNVQVTLTKEDEEWWPHLTRQKTKLPWLRVDFDRWRSESEDEAEGRDVINDYPDVYDRLLQEETAPRDNRLNNFRESYLIMYNLWQLLGFAVILGKLAFRYRLEGEDSMLKAYDTVGVNMKLAQGLQVLEILHPLFGMTRGGVLEPLMQVTGRNLMLFVVLEGEPRMQTKPAVFYLFVVWSLVEVVRYPYYTLRIIRREVSFVTWLRYTIWIPLYPLGFITEGVLYLRALPYFEETGRFSLAMPNAANMAFHFPTVLKALLLCAFMPGILVVMRHMYRQRRKVIGPAKVKQQ